MNPFDRQTEILNDLLQIVHDEADENYEKLNCLFALDSKEGWSEVKFSFFTNGVQSSKAISESFTWKIHSLLEELNTLMKDHTGGQWTSFDLTFDAGGEAHTKFHYPDK